MKKVLFVFVLLGVLSCSKDENSDSKEESVVGKWHLIDILENGSPISGYSCNKEFDITEFTSNGESIVKYSDKNSSNVCVQYTENGSYSVSDNILTEIQKEGSVKVYEAKYKIKELTATSLKLELIYTFESNSNGSNSFTENYAEGENVNVYIHID
jgi:hypothetical protein